MNHDVPFAELRRLLLELGFSEASGPDCIVFKHEPTDTLFVFRPYAASDPVAAYNLVEVRRQLDARGLLPAESFDDMLRKTPA